MLASAGGLLLLAGLGAVLFSARGPVGVVDVGPVTVDKDARPRGIRNNNPGNIEYSPANDWRGQVGSDGRYAIFDDPVNGIRALARLLLNYQRFYGLSNVTAIISRWAPPDENNTAAYIAAVADALRVDPLAEIDVENRLPSLVRAIIHHENGQQPYLPAVIGEGIRAAL